MRHVLFFTGCAALAASLTFAQTDIPHFRGERPSFEVATIKPWVRPPAPPASPDGAPAPVRVKTAPVGGGGQATNRVHLILPAALLIASAYNLPVGSEGRRVKGPDWLRDENQQYEIEAKIDDALFAAMCGR